MYRKGILWIFIGGFLTVVFFAAQPHSLFLNSPDETANLFYTNQIKEHQTFSYHVPDIYPDTLLKYIHPRSTKVLTPGVVIPISYLGLPLLYGLLSAVVGTSGIPILTSFFVLVLLYALAKKIFMSEWMATAATFLTLTLPPFLYFSIRGYFHSILFLLFVLIAAYFSFEIKKKKTLSLPLIFSAFFLAVAFWVRTNEAVWLVPLFIGIFIYAKISWKKIMLWFFALIISLLPIFFISSSLSGAVTQYVDIGKQSNIVSNFDTLKSLIFPFGVDIRRSFTQFWLFLKETWWVACFGLIGIILFILQKKEKTKRFWILTLFLLLASIFLVMYYGGLPIKQQKQSILISNSHFRYWLPFFFVFSVMSAYSISQIKKSNSIKIICLCVFAAGSLYYLFTSNTGIFDLRLQNELAYKRNTLFQTYLEPDALVFAGSADKYFFPDWQVVGSDMFSRRVEFVHAVTETTTTIPVYYYFVDADISSHFTKEALEKAGVKFTYVAQFWDGGHAWEYLYKLDWPNKEKHVDE